MGRKTRSLRIIEEFRPDPARCAAALLQLLDWQPPLAPAGAAGAGYDAGETGEAQAPHDSGEVCDG